MYRIELAPGEEAIFKSIDELATGIRGGVISDRARIYHKSSDKWLPVEFHPHFKIAKAKAVAAEAPMAAPLEIEYLPPIPTSASAASSATIVKDAFAGPVPAVGAGLPARPRNRTIGMVGAGALVLAAGGGLWGMYRRPADAVSVRPRETVTSLASYAGAGQGRSAVFGTTEAAGTTAPLSNADSAKAAAEMKIEARAAKKDTASAALPVVLPSAPPIQTGGGAPVAIGSAVAESSASGDMTPAVLAAHYAQAFDAARADLDKGFAVFGFSNVFGAARLSAGDGVPATRTAIGAVDGYLRNYRKRTEGIERTYRDSLDAATRQYGWSEKQLKQWEGNSQLEGPEVQLLGTSLLGRMDALFDVLATQAGQYQINGGGITFSDPQAAREYGALRQQIVQLSSSRSAPGTSVAHLLRAIGSAKLPQEN